MFLFYPLVQIRQDCPPLSKRHHCEYQHLVKCILGLVFSYLFFKIPKDIWTINKNRSQRNILFVLIIVAAATTFHAAMRTFVTPLFIILGVLKIKDNS